MSDRAISAVLEAAIRVIQTVAPKAGVVVLLAQDDPDGPGVVVRAASTLEDASACTLCRAHIAMLERPQHPAPAAVQ